MNNQTACFTGHRNLKTQFVVEIESEVKKVITDLTKQGVKQYLSGGARGFDLLCAQCVLQLKKEFPNIQLIMILPCRGQTRGWDGKDSALYQDVLAHADKVICLAKEYYDGCMLDRNDYMIQNSDYCIAYLIQNRGGTAYTVRKAKANGLKVYKIVAGLRENSSVQV